MLNRGSPIRYVLFAIACGACSSATSAPPTVGSSIVVTDNLTGCKGKASSSIPSDGVYVMTTFGGPSESQGMSCGSSTDSGSWYYAASRQRYGCGSHIRIEGNGNCVIAQTDDYGPDVCVENAAGRPIIDVSPLVAQAIFGVSGMGWSDNRTVTVTAASSSDALGPCSGSSNEQTGDPGSAGDTGSGGESGGSSAGGSSGGGGSSGDGSQCYCDDVCQQYGDCCSNCSSSGSGGSGGTSGSGGSGGSGSCYCDDVCQQYGDCCSNCGTSGSGGSSGSSGSGGSGGDSCYCDANCADYGDCCSDCV